MTNTHLDWKKSDLGGYIALDQAGNRYTQPENQETITIATYDGHCGTGFTEEEAWKGIAESRKKTKDANIRVEAQLKKYSKEKLIKMVRDSIVPHFYLRGCEDAVSTITGLIEDPYKEYLIVLGLNSLNKIIGKEVVSIGHLSGANVTDEQIKAKAKQLADQMVQDFKKSIECICPECGHEFKMEN